MDGVMFMHSRRLPLLRQVLDDGTSVGPLRRITSAFTFNGGDDFFAGNIRAEPSLEPLGCLGDLGWYCVRLSLWAMNWQMPRSVHGTLLAEARRPGAAIGVPIDLSAELRFDGGVSAGFHCSFVTGGQQWAMLTGTQGYVQMSDFTLPDFSGRVGFELVKGHYQVERCDITTQNEFIRHSVAERSNSHATAQESNMFRAFGAQILTGELSDFWPEIAWKTQRVVDACIESARRDRDA
jgi:predicted dehydrogenase